MDACSPCHYANGIEGWGHLLMLFQCGAGMKWKAEGRRQRAEGEGCLHLVLSFLFCPGAIFVALYVPIYSCSAIKLLC